MRVSVIYGDELAEKLIKTLSTAGIDALVEREALSFLSDESYGYWTALTRKEYAEKFAEALSIACGEPYHVKEGVYGFEVVGPDGRWLVPSNPDICSEC